MPSEHRTNQLRRIGPNRTRFGLALLLYVVLLGGALALVFTSHPAALLAVAWFSYRLAYCAMPLLRPEQCHLEFGEAALTYKRPFSRTQQLKREQIKFFHVVRLSAGPYPAARLSTTDPIGSLHEFDVSLDRLLPRDLKLSAPQLVRELNAWLYAAARLHHENTPGCAE